MHVLTNGCPPRLGEPNIAVVVAVEKQKCTLRFFYRPEQTRHLAKEVRSNGTNFLLLPRNSSNSTTTTNTANTTTLVIQ
jgi:hypothetical protein